MWGEEGGISNFFLAVAARLHTYLDNFSLFFTTLHYRSKTLVFRKTNKR